jgi:hypothetical protein
MKSCAKHVQSFGDAELIDPLTRHQGIASLQPSGPSYNPRINRHYSDKEIRYVA